jgi:hypothetical protein
MSTVGKMLVEQGDVDVLGADSGHRAHVPSHGPVARRGEDGVRLLEPAEQPIVKSRSPPMADPLTTTGGWRRFRARAVDVVITPTAPSVEQLIAHTVSPKSHFQSLSERYDEESAESRSRLGPARQRLGPPLVRG